MRFPETLVSPQVWQLFLVLGLSFLLGLEREGRKATASHYFFGGVRTFPLIGFVGYSLALVSKLDPLVLAAGLLAVCSFLVVSYKHKVSTAEEAGLTTEITGVLTYLLGALVASGWYWVATALVVISLFLLELKGGLERWAERVPSQEILTLTKFLLLSAVILPLVPNQPFTVFAINPFKLWLVVVAVSGLSYLSYLAYLLWGESLGLPLSAVLGGVYSSTATTVVLARRMREAGDSRTYAAAITVACSVMYARVWLLLWLFQPSLLQLIGKGLLTLFALGVAVAGLWLRVRLAREGRVPHTTPPMNPLELRTAFLFAAVFVGLSVGVRLVGERFGNTGLYVLSWFSGLVDVDPYVLSLAQQASEESLSRLAGRGIVLALSGNQLAKGVYSLVLAGPEKGYVALASLLAYSLATAATVLLI